ncbi:Mth938-like domain-containing protein [Calditrichota bacterium GD2]
MKTYRFSQGPIEEVSWGKFVIGGRAHFKNSDGTLTGAGKDICLIGKMLSPWRERKGHLLTQDMVRRVASADVDTVIIGNGFDGALQVPDEVKNFLEENGKTVIIEKTPQACERFNRMFRQGAKVALLAHGTC